MAHASAGIEAVYATFVDDDGLPTGLASLATPTSGSAGAVEAQSLTGIETLDMQVPEAPRVTIRGNDRALFEFVFKPSELSTGTMTLGVFDPQLAALAINQALVTQGFMTGRLVNPDTFSQKTLWLAVNAQAKSADSGNYGAAGYETSWLRVQITPRGRAGWNYQGEAQYNYDIIAVPFAALPWGITVPTATSNGANTADAFDGIFTPYKLTIARFVGNGSDTTFDLDAVAQEPATYSYASKIVSGTPSALTYDAVTPATGEYKIETQTVTLGDTLAEGDSAIVIYGRN